MLVEELLRVRLGVLHDSDTRSCEYELLAIVQILQVARRVEASEAMSPLQGQSLLRWWLGLTGHLEAFWSHSDNGAYIRLCCSCLVTLWLHFCEISRAEIFIILFSSNSIDTQSRATSHNNRSIEI